ncbi:MAG: hypothetical protein REI45_09160, partial [Propionicimonas sp.]|nr:hypothetical protein [Propionicimonas sp.]
RGAPVMGAVDAARVWVGCYTGWVGAEASERRRAEIESDLWEQQADASARDLPPATVALSIARRVVAGIPADLLWVHKQRMAARGRPAERKARLMNAIGRLAATWWWTVAAATLAGIYIWLGIGNLRMPGIPYLDGAIQAFGLAALMTAGIALLRPMPRLAGILAVAGGLAGVAIWWSPVIQLLGVAVCTGAAIEVMKHTEGAGARVLAGVGLLVVGLAPLTFVLAGTPTSITALHGVSVLAALAGIGLLVASGRHTREVATA